MKFVFKSWIVKGIYWIKWYWGNNLCLNLLNIFYDFCMRVLYYSCSVIGTNLKWSFKRGDLLKEVQLKASQEWNCNNKFSVFCIQWYPWSHKDNRSQWL
jgi:hypothetical protein